LNQPDGNQGTENAGQIRTRESSRHNFFDVVVVSLAFQIEDAFASSGGAVGREPTSDVEVSFELAVAFAADLRIEISKPTATGSLEKNPGGFRSEPRVLEAESRSHEHGGLEALNARTTNAVDGWGSVYPVAALARSMPCGLASQSLQGGQAKLLDAQTFVDRSAYKLFRMPLAKLTNPPNSGAFLEAGGLDLVRRGRAPCCGCGSAIGCGQRIPHCFAGLRGSRRSTSAWRSLGDGVVDVVDVVDVVVVIVRSVDVVRGNYGSHGLTCGSALRVPTGRGWALGTGNLPAWFQFLGHLVAPW
jgi:hypothetical protein